MEQNKLNRINTTALAYLGDAVYEIRIREHIIEQYPLDAGKAHHAAVKYVAAAGQARAARAMISEGFLSEEEERLLKRARNHRSMSRPANADPKDYKLATGFEAVLGYLHLTGNTARIQEISAEAIRIIDAASINK